MTTRPHGTGTTTRSLPIRCARLLPAQVRTGAVLTTAALALALGTTVAPAHAVTAPAGPALAARATTVEVAHIAPAAVVPRGRYAIGDSVMLGSKRLLTVRGITVNATVSRQFSQAVPTLAALRRANKLPRNVVVHLGTNGIVKVSDCRAIVDGAGSGRRIFLVTAHGARSWIPSANAHLRMCAKAYAGHRVVLVDWDKAATGHRSWFGSDGIHPSSTGRPHYVGLISAYLTRYGI